MRQVKRRIIGFILLLILCMAVLSCQASAKVKINKKSITLVNGTTYQLAIKNTAKQVKWKSSKKTVALVSADGLVTARKRGKAVITAKVGKKKYQCKVTVIQPVMSISFPQKSICLKKNGTYKMKAVVLPENANNKELKWSSSNKKVAKVSSKGKITGVGVGQAIITVTAKDGSGAAASFEVFCTLTGEWPSVIRLDQYAMQVTAGTTSKLNASGGSGVYNWSSSNPAVAKVANDGTITPVTLGSTTITVASNDGVSSASAQVTVVAPQPSAAAKTFLFILQKYSDELKAYRAAGKMVGYSNSGSLIETNWVPAMKVMDGIFDSTTKKGKGLTDRAKVAGTTYTNCALLARWALREMGILGDGNFWGINADGGGDGHAQCLKGIHFGSQAVKDQILKYCQIIEVHKSPNELVASGMLIPGDICTWHGMLHTNIYAGDGKWFDAGRGPSDGDYIKKADIPGQFSAVSADTLKWDASKDGNNPDLSSKIYVFNSFGPIAQQDRNVNGKVGYIIRLLKKPY